ncbi:TPR repeat-containing protein [Calothrix sp. NIES-4101]|nr:TPR repeat-containing protein [Calothrix sp. NIES-4101]
MNQSINDWDDDLSPEPEEVYQDLIRALTRKEGFGLFFVQCSQTEAERVITRIKQEIPQRKIQVLRLAEAINNLYQRVAEFTQNKQVDILLITGLEYSLYKYEKRNFGEISEGQFSNLSSVPPILNHLNQQRERFRDDFNICFVFILRSFSISYLIHRAPDFFDWRSGVFELPITPEVFAEESSRLILEGDYEEYLKLTPEQKIGKILEFQELVAEDYQLEINRADLLFKLGNLLVAANEYQAAISSYDEAVKIKPDYYQAWYNRGLALRHLERFEDAVVSFDKALQIKPDFDSAFNNRGAVLSDNLQRYEDAISSYQEAVKIKPGLHEYWFNQGIALLNCGRYQEAIISFEQALKIKPEEHKTWFARGNALYALELHQEAIESYNKAIELTNAIASINHQEESNHHSIINALIQQYYFLYKLDSLISSFVGYEDYKITPSVAKLDLYWRSRLYFDYQAENNNTKDAIVDWLLGIDLKIFEKLNSQELEIAKQAMEYRYKILRQRYFKFSREKAYSNLISILTEFITSRKKIHALITSNHENQHVILDILETVVQEILQTDKYIQEHIHAIAQYTTNIELRNALLFATTEEYCLRPISNQPVIVHALINYLCRNQRENPTTQLKIRREIRKGIKTTSKKEKNILLANTKEFPEINPPEINIQEIIQSDIRQTATNTTFLQNIAKEEFEEYLAKNVGQDGVKWLQLYLQGKSQEEIAQQLNKPIKEIYQLREKVSYYALRLFATPGKSGIIDTWLKNTSQENNFQLNQKQWQKLYQELTPLQRKILELRQKSKSIEVIGQQLKIKPNQVMNEWTVIYLTAQVVKNEGK